ncbi:MAG: bifunctional glutamate N-acetyltransferase/amino-acid acetyltransferase ArgJ [Mariniblastus sp.]
MLPLGFKFSGITCGIKESSAPDLALISTSKPSVAAGVYTQNVVRAASIDWNRNLTPSDKFQAVVINSGNANACTGQQGIQDNERMANLTSQAIGASPAQVLVLSTGVIGHLLPMDKIETGIQASAKILGANQDDFEKASQAILTTDKSNKTTFGSLEIRGSQINIAGMAKGAGMIGPNMATMLAIMMTDAKISMANAQTILADAARQSFNRISVEGHTSTNDALLLICSGESNIEISSAEDLKQFSQVLTDSCIDLAKRIPSDGEGSTHLVAIEITGAKSESEADQAARTIAMSALVKTAITGADPNWGRIVSAAGYSGVEMKIEETDLSINGHVVFKNGQPIEFDAALISQSMSDNFETKIQLKIGSGPCHATHWTSDLTTEYVRFNSQYTT